MKSLTDLGLLYRLEYVFLRAGKEKSTQKSVKNKKVWKIIPTYKITRNVVFEISNFVHFRNFWLETIQTKKLNWLGFDSFVCLY